MSKTIIYYSNQGHFWSNPEYWIGKDANIMLSFQMFVKVNKPDKRFRNIIKARRKAAKKAKS